MTIAQKHLDRFQEIKDNIKSSYLYFENNVKRYHEFTKFVFDTSMTNEEITKLTLLQKPPVEFNILEAIVSTKRSEFAKHEPGIEVRAADGISIEQLTPEYLQMMKSLENYLREIFFNAKNDMMEYKVFSDMLAGGFSVVEVYADYVNEFSFDQALYVDRVFDPTMTFFDPLARKSHKGDGRYCGQLFPRTKEEFEKEFGKEALQGMKFERNVSVATDASGASRSLGNFNWSYRNQDIDIVLVADYLEKVERKATIVKLSNGRVMIDEDYEHLLEKWNEQQFIEQPPIIIDKRKTTVTEIHRFVLCDTKLLKHEKTKYKFFPLVFFDGNSVNIRDSHSGSTTQMTRPYCFHAKGTQKLKNFSGQTIAAEIENMVMHRFKVALESIPDDYQEAYTNVQQASVLVYKQFSDDRPNEVLNAPMEIQRTPTPPIVENTFMGTDRTTQMILGTYDSVLGTNSNDISGVALQEGAMQGSMAADPYLIGFIMGLNQVANVIVDAIPKFYRGPRTLPVRTPDGKKSHQPINNPRAAGNVQMDYEATELQVKVEAGVNSSVQKRFALEMIIKMMQASPLFGQFINTMGLETILDNMEIRGIENLKAMAVQFMEQLQQQQAAAAEKGDPMEQINREQIEAATAIEAAKIEQKQLQAEGEQEIEAAKVAVAKQNADANWYKLMAELELDKAKMMIEEQKVDSENARTAVETAISVAQHHHSQREERDNARDEMV